MTHATADAIRHNWSIRHLPIARSALRWLIREERRRRARYPEDRLWREL